MLFSSFGSVIYFKQPLVTALIAEGKLLSASYIFLAYYYIRYRQISLQELLKILLTIFWISIVLYFSLQNFLEPSKYWYQDSQLFILDSKGYRMRLPVQIITLVAFYALANLTKSKFNVIIYLATLTYLSLLHQQRLYLIVFLGVSIVIIVMEYFKRHWKASLILSLPVLILTMFNLPNIFEFFIQIDSLSIRNERFFVIDKFFSKANFYNVIFGVGEINENWALKEFILGTKFSASDYGLIGILYEYGFTGLLFFFGFYFYLIKKCPAEEGILLGFKYFILFTILNSLMSPYLFYYTGLMCTLMGILLAYKGSKLTKT
jgi:hypothetical protein